MTFLRRRTRAVLAVLALAFTATSAAPIQAAETTPSSIRLYASKSRATLPRFGERVYLRLPLWVASTGGAFELRAWRDDYDQPVQAAQFDAQTGDLLRSIPSDLVAKWRGLRRFITVEFRDDSGALVLTRNIRFCPNDYAHERIDDSGPATPRYPTSCGSSYFPFLRGMVWGIDAGWAKHALVSDYSSPYVKVPDGHYSVTVRIADRYARLFEVPAEDAAATFDVTVKPGSRRREFYAAGSAPESPMLTPQQGVPTVTEPDPNTLPDLAALPGFAIGTRHMARRNRNYLAFAANELNAGPRALVVEGFRRPDKNVMDAYQYFYDANGDVVGRAPVGTLKYHAGRGHNHWHFVQFVAYTLHDTRTDKVVRSRKQSFCIVPTDAIDLTVDGAVWQPWSVGLESACGSEDSIWVREELDVGWGDTYYQGSAGQAFNITDLRNGWYNLKIEVNPLGNLYERDTTNNAETRLLHLGGRPGKRTVVVTPWHGIEP